MGATVEITVACDWLTDDDDCDSVFYVSVGDDTWPSIEGRVVLQAEGRGWVRRVQRRREVFYCPLHRHE